jgi:putative Ca2+/H+ antiporter (TMEM165/GDT1 family)
MAPCMLPNRLSRRPFSTSGQRGCISVARAQKACIYGDTPQGKDGQLAVRDAADLARHPLVLSLAAAAIGLVSSQPALASSLPGIGDYTSAQVTEGFVQGLLLIFFSELGDKTFFLALLLASSRPKGAVFAGTFGALAVMTVISVALGQLLHQLDESPLLQSNIPWDDVLAVILLSVFGVQTILTAKDAEATAAGEKEEAAEEVSALNVTDAGLVLSTFALVFAAEWGDKSFLATIALAAATSPVGVTAGAVTGHGMATALAVLGGGVLSRSVSQSTLQYGGGCLFLAFAVVSALDIVQKMAS